jgi:hypothetical protein
MTDLGALLFAIWVTANFCAILYCVRADWPVGRLMGRTSNLRAAKSQALGRLQA